MLNKAQVIGNLGVDPRVSVVGNAQTKVATFTVATTDRGYTTQAGVQVPEKTEWHNIVCFGKLADIAEKFLKKGSKVFIEGKMRTRSYDDKQGIKRYVMEINAETIEMLEPKQSAQPQQEQAPVPVVEPIVAQTVPSEPNEEDLPF